MSMNSFKNWVKLKESVLLNEADQLDAIIGELQKIINGKRTGMGGKIDFKTIGGLAYDYLTKHDDSKNLVRGAFNNDMKKYNEYNAKYKQLLGLVTNKLKQMNWSTSDNGAWQQYNRGGITRGFKDDMMTTKRYISINPNDIWTAFQKLPVLASGLEKVKLAPGTDVLSFKVATGYGAAVEGKDTIVIHFYDRSAGPQVDKAVQEFLNAAGINEMDRAKFGRTNFGKDVDGESDSQIVADRFAKYIEINKDKIGDFLRMPNLKQQLQDILHNISMKSSHRAGVRLAHEL